jgi:hypothetical protein
MVQQARRCNSSPVRTSAASAEIAGKLHAFYYMVNGATSGGRLDVLAFTLSYLQPGVYLRRFPRKSRTSKLYDGMKKNINLRSRPN